MSQKLVPWEGSWPSSLAWILLIGQTALFAWSQDIHRHWLQYYLGSILTAILSHCPVDPRLTSVLVSLCLRKPGSRTPQCLCPGVWCSHHTGHCPLSCCHWDQESHVSIVTIIIIPGVPTHPGDKLSAPAPTGHAALRRRPMCPAKPRI